MDDVPPDQDDQLRLAVEAAGLGVFTLDLATDSAPNRSLQHDRLFGHAALQPAWGQAICERHVIEEDRPRFRDAFAAALETGVLAVELRVRWPDGSVHWLALRGRTRAGPDGRPARIVGSVADVTAQKGAELRHRMLHETMRDAYVLVDMDGHIVETNALYRELVGHTAAELAALTYQDLTPERWHAAEAAIVREQVLPRGHSDVYEKEYRRKDGTLVPVELRTALARDDAGRPIAMWAIVRDIGERKRTEAQLRRGYETYLDLIENAPFGVYLIGDDFRLAQVSAGARKVFGSVTPLIGRDFAEVLRIVWSEPFASEAIARFRHTLATGEPFRAHDTTETRGDIGEVESYDWQIERVAFPDGRHGVVCWFYDLTERKRYEQRIELLMHEVNHRSKNMLSLLQAVARQTAASSPEEFLSRFTERMQALAASLDLLTGSGWTGVPLDELVRAQLAHFRDSVGRRIRLDGEPVVVSATAAQTIGMALHELATNAGKYGALSGETGWVAVRWGLRGDSGAPDFSIAWTEHDGPPVVPPTRKGFGSVVIDRLARGALDADIALDYAPGGVAWRLTCKAAAVLEPGSRPGPAR
ncbi:PAS domain S-box protein [Rhodoplanes sp. TEM]|nr:MULTISPECIES: PAS domain S-box protein [Rhodoplanes]MDC7986221.1 PAS domain S-box protein [Rhodoplanes sp. TEM]MDQ0355648.1 PAS domain S-box-containing protein [Rhodoplanes tepidamans]